MYDIFNKDLYTIIISFISRENNKDNIWFSLRLVNKQFLSICKNLHSPNLNDLYKMSSIDNLTCLNNLLKDIKIEYSFAVELMKNAIENDLIDNLKLIYSFYPLPCENKYYKDFHNLLQLSSAKNDIIYNWLLYSKETQPIVFLYKRIKYDFLHTMDLRRALYNAIYYNEPELIWTFLKQLSYQDIYSSYLLKYACTFNQYDLVVYVSKKIAVSVSKNYCIKVACTKGYTKIVEYLLQQKYVDPGVENNYCLRIACKKRYLEIIKLLMNYTKVRKTTQKPIIDISIIPKEILEMLENKQ